MYNNEILFYNWFYSNAAAAIIVAIAMWVSLTLLLLLLFLLLLCELLCCYCCCCCCCCRYMSCFVVVAAAAIVVAMLVTVLLLLLLLLLLPCELFFFIIIWFFNWREKKLVLWEELNVYWIWQDACWNVYIFIVCASVCWMASSFVHGSRSRSNIDCWVGVGVKAISLAPLFHWADTISYFLSQIKSISLIWLLFLWQIRTRRVWTDPDAIFPLSCYYFFIIFFVIFFLSVLWISYGMKLPVV